MEKEIKLNVINLHLTDKCNFQCHHCFVKKENKELKFSEIEIIVNKIQRFFEAEHISDGRITLAGGEPLLYKELNEVIDLIFSKNIKVSLITNGFLLTEDFLQRNKEKLSMVGISIDSVCDETNRKIGRCMQNKVLSERKYIHLGQMIKDNGIKLKINVCLSKINASENMVDFIKKLKPDRLKILQMKSEFFMNSQTKSQVLSQDEFEKCCQKYQELNSIIETNETMEDSYLIIDSKGCLAINNLHNSKEDNSVLKNEISEIISKLNINPRHFQERYVDRETENHEDI